MYKKTLSDNLKEYMNYYNKSNESYSSLLLEIEKGNILIANLTKELIGLDVDIDFKQVSKVIESNLLKHNVSISKIIDINQISIKDIERISEGLDINPSDIYPFEEFEIKRITLFDLEEDYKGPKFEKEYLEQEFNLNNWLKNGACEEVGKGYIIDGDTISVSYQNEMIRVRLLVIDTPEIFKKNDKWSLKARDFTRNIIEESSNIYLQLDNKSEVRDKYGRVLSWVWIKHQGEMKLLNALLVQIGLASVKYISYKDSFYIKELKELEEQAKKENKVMWNKRNIDPNWNYETNSHKIKGFKIEAKEGFIKTNDYELENITIDKKGTIFRTKEDCELLIKKHNSDYKIVEDY